MKILKKGININKNQNECKYCKCEYEYDDKDVESENLDNIDIDYISCPYCHKINILSKTDNNNDKSIMFSYEELEMFKLRIGGR